MYARTRTEAEHDCATWKKKGHRVTAYRTKTTTVRYKKRGATALTAARTVGAVDEHGGDDGHVRLRLDRLPVLVLVHEELQANGTEGWMDGGGNVSWWLGELNNRGKGVACTDR